MTNVEGKTSSCLRDAHHDFYRKAPRRMTGQQIDELIRRESPELGDLTKHLEDSFRQHAESVKK